MKQSGVLSDDFKRVESHAYREAWSVGTLGDELVDPGGRRVLVAASVAAAMAPITGAEFQPVVLDSLGIKFTRIALDHALDSRAQARMLPRRPLS
jgi:hypothetical protein